MNDPIRKLDRDLVRGSLDLLVLSVLAEGPAYGYLLQKRIREGTEQFVKVPPGTLYPILFKLEQEGAVSFRWERVGGRDRKWYELTELGHSRLEHHSTHWQRYVSAIGRVVQQAHPRPQAGLAKG